MLDFKRTLDFYIRLGDDVKSEHKSADQMVQELGLELELLAQQFASHCEWTEPAAMTARRRRAEGRHSKPRNIAAMFDSSSEEEDLGEEGLPAVDEAGASTAAARTGVIQDHVKQYMAERLHEPGPSERRCKDPLLYWAKNQARWPMLAAVARHSLCVPASSSTSERSFSKTGHIVRARRASLSDDCIRMLSFLAWNGDCT